MGRNAQVRRLAAVAPPTPTSVRLSSVQIELPSGRPAALTVPSDITDGEIVSVIAAVIQYAERLRIRGRSPIVIA